MMRLSAADRPGEDVIEISLALKRVLRVLYGCGHVNFLDTATLISDHCAKVASLLEIITTS
jgi:hypothetical protein